MLISKDLLTNLGVTSARADKFVPELNTALPEYEIDTGLRVAHFLAQVLHESGKLRHVEENLNYSSEALLKVFGKYFTPSEAADYARDPKRIGSRVYGGRMGNGPEQSGEGYRYRGRGLIQLTGKNNYRKFSDWVGDDMVARPDSVATQYPVRSAVYYWDMNNLNTLADSDEVRMVTKRINGGFNGLPDRIALLSKAKTLLAIDVSVPALEGVTHHVTASTLNLRSQPKVSAATRIGALPEGTAVVKVANADEPGWTRVRVMLNGQITEGYVSTKYLKAARRAEAVPATHPSPAATPTIPPAHLRQNHKDVTRTRDGGRAFPLGEVGHPRRTGVSPSTKARKLIEIVDYLDSENREHRRYWPKDGTTFCNIYAYDYCFLADVYLPRVWWRDKALQQIRAEQTPTVKYGDTVRELNANMLLDWLEDHGVDFGWVRVFNLDVLQASANQGEVCLIVAQREDLNRSGHIVAVVPENGGVQAARNDAGEVLRPLESQAGVKNHRYVVKPTKWWTKQQFQSFSFWRHN